MQKEKKVKPSSRLKKDKQRDLYVEELIADVTADFERRRAERVRLERQWELNMNFLAGNQYCFINGRGEIASEDKKFYWQNKAVFNHVAPIVESRLAKFSRITPTVFVRPKSDDDVDVENANLAEKFMEGVFKRANLEDVIKKGTNWSETCGTAFYKVVWNNDAGSSLGVVDGREVFEGDVEIFAVSPFEIFPDSLYVQDVQDCNSIIHAKAMSVADVKQKYGVTLSGSDIGVFSLSGENCALSMGKTKKDVLSDAVLVIERYEKPCERFPNGRIVTVAGDKLLYVGDLPYVNGGSGSRAFPFVKQISIDVAGEFFGISIIERMIPVQRAFNAVKNRKHEFLNRLSMGVMTVEDGSVDTDDLAEEGLSPGKVLVYRQGSKAPEMMSMTDVPADFNQEEDRLLNEFVIISGVSDVVSSSSNATLSSGTALEILVEQDNERLVFTAESIRRCYLEIAKQTIRLYSQFMGEVKAIKYHDKSGKFKVVYANKKAIGSDDVYLDSENELLSSHRQKKEMILKLYQSGLLNDDNGKIRASTKEKVLTLLGYKDLDYKKGISRLHEEKAQAENPKIRKLGMPIEEIDDDIIHIDEHTRYILSEYESLTENEKTLLCKHVSEHKARLNINDKGE